MATPEQKVQVFSLALPKPNTPKDKRRYKVKWAIDGRHKTRSFKTREQADRLRSALLQAVRDGYRFDVTTGEPIRWAQTAETWWTWSRTWYALKWPSFSGHSRRSAAETLVAITPHLVRSNAPAPPLDLAPWLWSTGFDPQSPESAVKGREARWLERWSIPLAEVEPGLLESALVAATTRRDGQRMSSWPSKRRFNGVKAVFTAAVRRGLIESNPVDRIMWTTPTTSGSVNVNVLPSVADVLEVVDDLATQKDSYAQYAAFYATIVLAGMRPSEVAALRVSDLRLPSAGWGEAHLSAALTSPGTRYTDDGDWKQSKGLKNRSGSSTRTVPLPPNLVERLRWHIDRWLRSGDEAVFQNRLGNTMASSNWSRPWRRMRAERWPDGHRLADTVPYDLRHTAATMMLRAGVSPAEVARRLGHSVEMLTRIYAGVFEDEIERSNALIESELLL